nr:uncharacterized protein F54H12.2-like [Crassostrea gigas]
MCGMDNLELFQVPPTNIALEESKWMEYYPISSTLDSDTAPIEFDIQGQGDEYIDLSQTYLQIVCKFTKDDGTNLTGINGISTPVNNIIHFLFSEIDLTLNGKIITPGTDTYPYKAYLEKLLSYRPETLDSQMFACSLWEKDTAGKMDDCNIAAAALGKTQFDVASNKITITAANMALAYPAGSENEGLRKRHNVIENSKKITLIDRLYLDIFQQDKFIPNGVDIRLRLNRTKSDFYMMTLAGSTGKIKLLNVLLWEPNPKSATIFFKGKMPKRIVLGLIPNDAPNGTSTNFNFKNCKVKRLDVTINGETISTRPYEPDFENDLYLRSYLSLYQGLGKFGADWAPGITYDEYKDGYTLWCIDFTKDQEAQLDKFHLIETGNLRIEIQFAENTAETLNCLVYAEFDNVLEINKQREVSTDF